MTPPDPRTPVARDTLAGSMKHLERALIVAFHRSVARPLVSVIEWLGRQPFVVRLASIIPDWFRLPSLQTIGVVYLILVIGLAIAVLLSDG